MNGEFVSGVMACCQLQCYVPVQDASVIYEQHCAVWIL